MALSTTPLPPIAADRAGFSAEGLSRIDRFFAREIEADRVPGAVVAIARDGKLVYYKTHGFLDKARGIAMPLDAIFHLASMTKVMTCVAALQLNESGRLPLRSRLDAYFPQFSNMRVAVASRSGELQLTPAARPIYLHDLFRHTSGLTYGGRGTHPVSQLYPSGIEAALRFSASEFVDHIASLPLAYQPGTVFEYGFSTDVLGVVVESLAQMRLGEHLLQHLWRPIDMPDTTFAVPAEKKARLAQPLPTDPVSHQPQRIPILEQQVRFDGGGGCAFGTVADYLRFGQMLLNGGVLDGTRILSPKTVAAMTADHLGAQIKNNVALIEPHREGYGFGLGVAVRLHAGIAAVPGSPGDFSWNGATGTAFWADPKERLVAVLGTAAPGDIRKYYREQFGALVYGAMTELR